MSNLKKIATITVGAQKYSFKRYNHAEGNWDCNWITRTLISRNLYSCRHGLQWNSTKKFKDIQAHVFGGQMTSQHPWLTYQQVKQLPTASLCARTLIRVTFEAFGEKFSTITSVRKTLLWADILSESSMLETFKYFAWAMKLSILKSSRWKSKI